MPFPIRFQYRKLGLFDRVQRLWGLRGMAVLLFVLTVLMALGSRTASGQTGAPFTRNYLPQDLNDALPEGKRAAASFRDVANDGRGVLYFANEKGVLEYDGVGWRLLAVPDSNGATALAAGPNGRIYVGTATGFGVLLPDSVGRITYHAIGAKSPPIRQVVVYGREVLFVGQDVIYQVEAGEMNSKQVAFNVKSVEIESRKNLVFVPEWGIVSVVNGKAQVATKLRKARNIRAISPYNEKHVLIASESELYLYNGIDYKPFPTQAANYLRQNAIADVQALPDNKWAIGTLRGGMVWLDKDGSVEYYLDRSSGLPSQTVNRLGLDPQNGLWLCLGEGLTRADVTSPLTRFEAASDLQGAVQTIAFHNNTLYVATTMGLFYLNARLQRFRPVVGILSNAWAIESLGNSMFAATSSGLYRIVGDTARILSNQPARCLAIRPGTRDRLYAGLYNGLATLRDTEYGKDKKKKDKDEDKDDKDSLTLDTSSTLGQIIVSNEAKVLTLLDSTLGRVERIAFETRNRAWVQASQKMLYVVLRKDDSIGKVYYPSKGLPDGKIRLLQTRSRGIRFATPEGLMKYNTQTSSFEADNWLGPFWAGRQIDYLYEDPRGNVLISSPLGIAFGTQDPNTNEFKWRQTEFRRLQEILVNNVYAGRDGAHWIGSEEGLIHYDPKRGGDFYQDFATLIRSVWMEGPKGRIELSGGSFGINLPQVNQDSLSIARSSQLLDVRKLHVEFAAPFYDDPASTVYRYRLYNAGIDSTWSPWTNQTAVEMNVPGVGEYEFQVEAKNVYNVTSVRAFYRFEVVPRWHETFWARALFVLGLLLVLGLLVYLFIRWQTYRLQERNRVLEEMVEARTQELRIEQEKSENLLLNILPKAIADELKEKDRADAREYERVTVLFTDFKGFTKVSEKLSPNAIIEELNVCFTAFDDIMGKYHLEKIKTIGDAYMCAGGIPAPNPTNPVDMVLAALEIQEFMRKMAVLKTARGEDFWELRLGIHTGPLVAGVVGKKKFAYDIWGDTVNTASRMESSGEPNRVNISGTTYDLVSEFFVCTYRGKLPAKNKGDIDMYFVERLRPELSLDAAGLIPNDLFYARLKKELGTAAYAPVKTG